MKFTNLSQRASKDSAWPLTRADGQRWPNVEVRRGRKRIVPLDDAHSNLPAILACAAMLAMVVIVGCADLLL